MIFKSKAKNKIKQSAKMIEKKIHNGPVIMTRKSCNGPARRFINHMHLYS